MSKKWKDIVYSQDFHNGIGLPTEHFLGNEAWKKLRVDVENEPRLPLRIYRDVEPKDFLVLVHKTIKIDGKEMKLTPKLLGELAAMQIKGLNQTGFNELSYEKAINEHQGSKTLHWVWIKADPIGKNEIFSMQENSAKKVGCLVSEYFDTLVYLFLDRVKSESLQFNWNNDTWIRVADKIDKWRIWIGFCGSSSLSVINNEGDCFPYEEVCVAGARKSASQ